jgi:hypothetical protein
MRRLNSSSAVARDRSRGSAEGQEN